MVMEWKPRARAVTCMLGYKRLILLNLTLSLALLSPGSPKLSSPDSRWEVQTESAEKGRCLLPLLASRLRGGMDYNRFQGRDDRRFPYGERPFQRDMGWSERGRKHPSSGNSIAVKGLVQSVIEQNLIDYFDAFGSVSNVNLLPSNPRYPSRMAYVKFLEPMDVLAALDHDRDTPSWNAGRPIQIISQDPQFHENLRREQQEIARRKQEESRMREQEKQKTHDESGGARAPRLVGDWVQVLSRSTGRYYWMNKVTKETSWNLPPQVQAEEAQESKPPKKSQGAVKTQKSSAPKQQKKSAQTEPDSSSSEEDGCDSEGYLGEGDRQKLAELPMLDRELILSERLEQKEARRQERLLMKGTRTKHGEGLKTPAKTESRETPRTKRNKSSAPELLGENVIGKKIRVKIEEDGQWMRKNGLVVQVKEVDGSQQHRIVWNDGTDDSWLVLQEHEVEFLDQEPTEGRKKEAQKRPAKSRSTPASKETVRRKQLDVEHDSGTRKSFVPQKRTLQIRTEDVKKPGGNASTSQDMNQPERRKEKVAHPYDQFFEKFRIRDECFRRMQEHIRKNISMLLETHGESMLPEFLITNGDYSVFEIEKRVLEPPTVEEVGKPVSLEQHYLTPLERLVLPPSKIASKVEKEMSKVKEFYGVELRDRLWELWNENVVKGTEEDKKWREWYGENFHEIESDEVREDADRLRVRRGTEDWIGPNAMRVESTEEETRGFFEQLYWCNFRIDGKEIVLPGREKIARKMQFAYAKRKESFAKIEAEALENREKRSRWAFFNESNYAGFKEVEDGGEGQEEEQSWAHMAAFLVDHLPGSVHLLSLLAARQEDDRRLKSACDSMVMFDCDYPDTQVVAEFQVDLVPATLNIFTSNPEAAVAMLRRILVYLEKWPRKPLLILYPACLHHLVYGFVIREAEVPAQWLEPQTMWLCDENLDVAEDKLVREAVRRIRGVKGVEMMSGEVLELDAESSTTLRMSKIGMEDVDLIVQHWNYETDTTRDYVSFLIEWKVTVGMYVQHQENTRSLVAWAIEGRDGSIEMIFSLPEWRHNGLARAALHQLTTILLNSHKLQRRLTAPFCTIANADFAMKQLLMASGFTAASELHVLQVGDFALFPAYPEEMEVVYVPQIANTLIPPCGVRRTVYHETLDNHRRLSLAESIETSIKGKSTRGELGLHLKSYLRGPENLEKAISIMQGVIPNITRENCTDILQKSVEELSLPPEEISDPHAYYINKWRTSVATDGKTFVAAYDHQRTGKYLRHEWIEAWIEHARMYDDVVPKFHYTREDLVEKGLTFP